MITVYNVLIKGLSFIYGVGSLFIPKARDFVSGRKGLLGKIESLELHKKGKTIWMHCASLGEFEQGRPVLEALKSEFPDHLIILTFFSPSGYELRKGYKGADYVFYLPWDTHSNAERFVSAVNPVLGIFVKYEFWFHYSHALKKRNIPLISISSIFRDDQLFFRSYGNFYRRILQNFSFHFVQNHDSLRLLKSININNAQVAGDTRFDRVSQILKQNGEIEVARKFKAGQQVMVVGSCWPQDFEVLAPLINEQRMKFIIAPHEITESFLTSIEASLQVKSIRFSEATGKNLEDHYVLLIDNIGMLSRLYRYGEFAFIGGAFGKGLHNILEAACYGVPVFFGNKNFEKFQEATDLINRGGAFDVNDFDDLKATYEMVNLPENFMLACEVTRQYVEENTGATEKIMNYCRKILQS